VVRWIGGSSEVRSATSNVHDLVTERLETLLLARLSASATPPTDAAIASSSHRYAPAGIDLAPWRERVTACMQGLAECGLIDEARRVVRTDELKRRTGAAMARSWQQWSDRILPALALGIRADDARSHKLLSGRDLWAAAIVARAQGLWTEGPPPSVAKLCDAIAWRELGLATAPKQCPAEVRSHFLRAYIDAEPGPPEKLIRLLASQAIDASRPDLRAFQIALIRAWLTGRVPAVRPAASDHSLIDAVRSAAREARDGVFGDRKVFISSVWNVLRATPPWSRLPLEDFKAQLVSAHRSQKLELARADLVAAMDPALVASSETRTDGATFHFIVREPLQ
jgi:hypothetical protein